MSTLHLRLPATSANLGPGFDALGLALNLWLDIVAAPAEQFAIHAIGRNAAQIEPVQKNLMLETYKAVAPHAPALALTVHNEIPLGMGCGSSAAALLAGVLLANHFGELGLSGQQVLEEACRREGHPDNVAACFHGGLTASAVMDGVVVAASFGHSLPWTVYLALPAQSLSTSVARALLPDRYARADAVANVQSTALLVAAFSLARPELLDAGTRDRLHQPYRVGACPLFERLATLPGNSARDAGIYSITLSGAGPSALILADPRSTSEDLRPVLSTAAAGLEFELIRTGIAGPATVTTR